MAQKTESELFGKNYRYDEVVDLLESIGYKHRVANYYFMREDDGYINISYFYERCRFRHIITFHKNFYMKRCKMPLSVDFDNFESFFEFISDYHSKLFLKQKIEKINENINKL